MRGMGVGILLLLTATFSVQGTAQIPDKLVFQGVIYDLQTNPLEPYFKAHPRKRPQPILPMTALWRGYVATFEFRNNQLFLVDVETLRVTPVKHKGDPFRTVMISVFHTIFPGKKAVKADWFSGILVCPAGERVEYVHMGYGTTFTFYHLYEIQSGDLRARREYTLDEYKLFRKKQFEAFKETEEYAQQAAELKRTREWTQERIDDFLYSFIIEYTSRFLVE